MKKVSPILLFACALLSLSRCYNRDGYCNNPPRFSSTTLNFDAKGGSGVMSSSGSTWDFDGFTVDSCPYQAGEGDCRLTFYSDTLYIPDDYHHQYPQTRLFKVEGAWFSMDIERDVYRNPRRLLFSVQPNETGKSRTLRLQINGRNCGVPDLIVTQSAE